MFKLLLFVFIIIFLVFFNNQSPPYINQPEKGELNEIVTDQTVFLKDKKLEDEKIKIQNNIDDINNTLRLTFSFFEESNYNLKEKGSIEKVKKSIILLEETVIKYKDDSKSRYFLGKLYLMLGYEKKAEKVLKEAIKLKSNNIYFMWNKKWAENAEKMLGKLKE